MKSLSSWLVSSTTLGQWKRLRETESSVAWSCSPRLSQLLQARANELKLCLYIVWDPVEQVVEVVNSGPLGFTFPSFPGYLRLASKSFHLHLQNSSPRAHCWCPGLACPLTGQPLAIVNSLLSLLSVSPSNPGLRAERTRVSAFGL